MKSNQLNEQKGNSKELFKMLKGNMSVIIKGDKDRADNQPKKERSKFKDN